MSDTEMKTTGAVERETLSGYTPGKQLAAQRIIRNGRPVFLVSLPIELVSIHLPIPDPHNPFELNRLVLESRAKAFGRYWVEHPDSWTVPPLLVDTSALLEFEPRREIVRGAEWGVLLLPNTSSHSLRILDGQHRILGWHLKLNELTDHQAKFLQRQMVARKEGDKDAEARAKEGQERTERLLQRMRDEQVTLEILTGISEAEHKNFFVTVTKNAKGINRSEEHRMDESGLDSIAARELSADLDLLDGKIEERRPSALKNSRHLMSLKNLCDIVRHTAVGINGRISAARQRTLRVDEMTAVSRAFFDGMVDTVPAIKAVSRGEMLAKDLRKESLFGSVTIWRCLAGAYFVLAVEADEGTLTWKPEGHRQFVDMVKALTPYMSIKDKHLVHNEKWVATRFVNDGELAPRSRQQDLKGLTDLFVLWAQNRPFQPTSLEA